jgi:predicted Zn-dependent protease
MAKEVEAAEDETRKALDMNPGEPTLTIMHNSLLMLAQQLKNMSQQTLNQWGLK